MKLAFPRVLGAAGHPSASLVGMHCIHRVVCLWALLHTGAGMLDLDVSRAEIRDLEVS